MNPLEILLIDERQALAENQYELKAAAKRNRRVHLRNGVFVDVLGSGGGTFLWIGADEMKEPLAIIYLKELADLNKLVASACISCP